jgi:hypothetical protein
VEAKLDNAYKELLYWFGRCRELSSEIEQLQINYNRMAESKDTYQKLLQEERKKSADLEKRFALLQ